MNDVLHFCISFIDKVMHRLNVVSFFLSYFSHHMSCFAIFLITCSVLFLNFNLTVKYHVKFYQCVSVSNMS